MIKSIRGNVLISHIEIHLQKMTTFGENRHFFGLRGQFQRGRGNISKMLGSTEMENMETICFSERLCSPLSKHTTYACIRTVIPT